MSEVRSHYLPHHPMLMPSKKSTIKVHIVHNASANAQYSSSNLNECLHHGPIMFPDLIRLLSKIWIASF